MDIYIKVCSTLVVLVLLLLIIVIGSNIICKESSDLEMSRPKSPDLFDISEFFPISANLIRFSTSLSMERKCNHQQEQ